MDLLDTRKCYGVVFSNTKTHAYLSLYTPSHMSLSLDSKSHVIKCYGEVFSNTKTHASLSLSLSLSRF